MWTKVGNVAAVVAFVAAGLFLLIAQTFTFFVFSAKGKGLFQVYATCFLIFVGLMLLGLLLRGFRNWRLCFGSVLLSVTIFNAFFVLTVLCDVGAPGDPFKMKKIESMVSSPYPGFAFCAMTALFGFLLVRSRE